MLDTAVPGQRFFAPEVVQTSAMDCGPAALKSLLDGFNIPVSYGRLREACQTDVDGTSINTIEDIAIQLGLRAEQVMLPVDHLALPEAQALPAILVVQRPSGMTHFLVIWGQVGRFLQVMDPATGRRWPTWKRLRNEVYVHTFPVPTAAWREWAGSEGLSAPLRRRLLNLRIEPAQADRLIEEAAADPGWRPLATLDAAVRMTTALVDSKGITAGAQAGKVLERFYRLNLEGPLPKVDKSALAAGETQTAPGLMIPAAYWSVLPYIQNEEELSGAAPPEMLLLRGAVMVRILGVRDGAAAAVGESPAAAAPLSPDLQAALKEPSSQPLREVWKALRDDGLLTPIVLALAIFLATVGVLLEALLFQGMLQLSAVFSLPTQRMAAAAAMVFFILALLLLEFPINATIMRMGRRLEARLRISYLEKIPRLGDRYFRSRLTSDMTQRAHDLRQLRMLPGLGVGLLRTGFQLVLTAIGVIILDPISAPLAILGTIFFVLISLGGRPILEERDLRLRTHLGALSSFYLDALLGLVPLKTHGAERALRRQHETQLYEWVRTGREYYSLATLVQTVGTLFYSLFSIVIVVNYLLRGGDVGEIFLLFYWTLSLPGLGQSLAELIQQYPMQRNRVLRLLEPLGAPDEEEVWAHDGSVAPPVDAQPASTDPASPPMGDPPLPPDLPGEPTPVAPDSGAPPVSPDPAGPPMGDSLLLPDLPGEPTPVAPNSGAQTTSLDPASPSSGDPPLPSDLPGEPTPVAPASGAQLAVSIDILGVDLYAGGHAILQGVNLNIAAGEHVAIVGVSGAGKSSLVGLLLGWHRPSAGSLLIDSQPLDGERLQALRRQTAWVDPGVQLWNRSFFDNLRYGNERNQGQVLGDAIQRADLYGVLERLPDGLKTVLGEGGGLVSGGEGQRVRLGRAMLRPEVRLAILDEPFRGLDREKRRKLLVEVRQYWAAATLLCITHDVGETLAFPRVLVIENGRIVEDANPADLAADENSRYRSLLEAEEAVRRNLWSGENWRRLLLKDGLLQED